MLCTGKESLRVSDAQQQSAGGAVCQSAVRECYNAAVSGAEFCPCTADPSCQTSELKVIKPKPSAGPQTLSK